MGISIEQYRAVIGGWNAGKIRKTLSDPAPIVMDLTHEEPSSDFKFRGPWKLHALLLILLTLLLVLVPVPAPTWHQCMLSQQTAARCPMTPTNLMTSLVSKQTHDNLLLIGGIEPHPGPNTQEVTEKRTSIIAELVCKAESRTVKDTLRLYKPTLHQHQLRSTLDNNVKVNGLVETMSFLGVSDTEKYNKSTILTKLISRIQSLFPDECGICSDEFVVKLEDTVLLSCAICKQGIHSRCLARKIGVAEVDLSKMTQEELWTKVNPCGLSTLTYLCAYCHTSEIPSPDQGLKRKPAKSKKVEEIKTGSQILSTAEFTDWDSDIQPADDTAKSVRGSATDSDDADVESVADSEEEKDPPPRRRPKSPVTKPRELNRSKPEDQPIKQDDGDKPICPYYRKGQCRYGIGGKGCPKSHPSLCRRLMTNGTKGARGCTKGKACPRFHPKMCPSSIAHHECLNDACSLYHIKGTRRMNSRTLPEKTKRQTTKGQNNRSDNTDSQSKSTERDAFLDLLNVMKREILQAMDVKIQEARIQPPAPVIPQQQMTPDHLIPPVTNHHMRGYRLIPY